MSKQCEPKARNLIVEGSMDIDEDKPEPPERPLWVQIGLWGIPGRSGAWGFFGFSLVLAIGCIAYGFVDPVFFFGGLFLFAALWYYLAIQWVDQHGQWS